MLAAALGLDISEAAEALQFDIAVTVATDDSTAMEVASELVTIMGRTIRTAAINEAYNTALIEVIIGAAQPQSNLKKLYVSISNNSATIGDSHADIPCAEMPSILSVLIACYICAAVMQRVFKDGLPFHVPDPLIISFEQLGIDQRTFSSVVELGQAYLVGAGAIGNGFLWAARHLDIRGQLDIVDDDSVSSGNLNRQVWFNIADIGQSKVERLAHNAQRYFPHLKLVPRKNRLQELEEKSGEPWLKRALIAVDSRRARREIQKEFPGEVFDASTTDIQEVVVHYHKQPTETACLSCIYEADRVETSREAHIAEHFGVSIEEVRKERISEDSATRISERFPKVDRSSIVGLAYDTLFKQLCGQGELKTLEGRRVVAPFAFVSVLAGVLMALELVRRLDSGNSTRNYNYWRVSPWHPPLLRRQILRPKQPNCEFCSDPILSRVNAALWSD